MYQGYTIKPLIFAGRKETMEILFPLLNSEIIDEVIVGINTKNIDDISFIEKYTSAHNKFKPVNIPTEYIGTLNAYIYMFNQMRDSSTIYIKLDDDLIYLSKNFFTSLVQYRIQHPEPICVYPFIINNPLCNYLGGWFKHDFTSQSDYMFHTWNNPKYAYMMLMAFSENKLPLPHSNFDFKFDDDSVFNRPEIGFPICPSINAICFYGKDCDYMNWPDKIKKYGGDEGYITNGIFKEYGNTRKHVITASALCVHYAFYTQRPSLTQTNILSKFKVL